MGPVNPPQQFCKPDKLTAISTTTEDDPILSTPSRSLGFSQPSSSSILGRHGAHAGWLCDEPRGSAPRFGMPVATMTPKRAAAKLPIRDKIGDFTQFDPSTMPRL
jgi:hypothetical protein